MPDSLDRDLRRTFERGRSLDAIDQAALDFAARVTARQPRCDYTIGQLPNGGNALSTDIFPIFRNGQTFEVAVGSIPVPGSASSLGWFNVKTYGALGNGINDDSTAIQTTINTCIAAGGGIVYFPPGTYSMTATSLNFNNGPTVPVWMLGAGPFTSILKLSPAFGGGAVIYDLNPCTDKIISDLGFVGNAVHAIDGITFVPETGSQTVSQIKILRNAFSNFNYLAVAFGIVIDGGGTLSTDCELSDNYITGCIGGSHETVGIYGQQRFKCLRNVWENNAATAINVYGYNTDCIFSENIFTTDIINFGDAIFTNAQNVVWSNNVHRGGTTTEFALELENVSDFLITGNKFYGGAAGVSAGISSFDWSSTFDGHPVTISASNNVTISNNEFTNYAIGVSFPSQTSAGHSQNMTNYTIADNTFNGLGTNLVLLNGGSATGIAGVRVFDNVFQGSPDTINGIYAFQFIGNSGNAAGVTDISVGGNKFSPGSYTALRFTDVVPAQFRVHPNYYNGVSTGIRLDGASATTGLANPTSLVLPGALTAPTVPASAATFNNPYPFPCLVVFTMAAGGVLTSLTLGGSAGSLVAVSSGSLAASSVFTATIPAYGRFVLTYGAGNAPTWTWYSLY